MHSWRGICRRLGSDEGSGRGGVRGGWESGGVGMGSRRDAILLAEGSGREMRLTGNGLFVGLGGIR